MFGNNSTSSWANPQQSQQQQPQQPSAFGQPSQPNAFGTAGAFGGGAFGQPQQQPQQAANPMFGNLGGSTTTPAGTSGFGAFGSNTASTAFGAPKPATGFGAFGGGGGNAFGGGGAFGSTANAAPAGTGGGLFGQSTNTGTSAFGASGGLFGSKPAGTAAFGSSAGGPTTDSNAAAQPATAGTANVPFNVIQEKETNNQGSSTLHYQSISFMPEYVGYSFEELRLADYKNGLKAANQGAFGQTPFGAQPQPAQATSTLFGQAQPAQPAGTNAFGAFGQTNQANQGTGGVGAFGQPSNPQPSAFGAGATGGGLFGGGTFGQTQQQQQQPGQQGTANAFGAFGQTNAQPAQQPGATGGGLFGGGAFGAQQQNKPAFGSFGGGGNAFGSGTGAFGQTANQPQQPAATGNIFGAQNPQQAQPSAFGAFGQNNNNVPKPSIFGTTQPAQQPTSAFGLFGQNQQNQPGQQPQQQQPQQSTGSLFGTGTGLFGQNANQQQGQQQGQQQQPQQQPQQGGLFGTTQPAQQPAGGSLFGTGGGLFGNTQQQQGAQKPGAFGSSIFGQPASTNNTAAPAQQANIFGQQPLGQSTQPSTGTGAFGLFGNKPAGTSSLFGQQPPAQQASNNLGGSLFGNSLGGSTNAFGASASGPPNQGTLTASVAQPVSTNLPIFNLLPPGPRAVALDQQPKKPSSYFVDVPTRSPLNMSAGRFNPGAGKLRGFGSSQTAGLSGRHGNPFASSLSLSSSHSNALSLTKSADSRALLGPEAFMGTPMLGSGGKPSPKKLVLDKKVEPGDLFGKAGPKGSGGHHITFSPVLGAAAREKETFASHTSKSSANAPATPLITAATKNPSGRFSAHSTHTTPDALKGSSKDKAKDIEENLQEGDYWVKPRLDVLRNASNVELSSFKGLVVGRVGFGEVHFLQPVDLTTLPRLSALLGKVIQIDNKECCVYPDGVESDDTKPQAGEGINVHARIMLLGCWPVDKATREPIKDEKHPAFARHLKRLKNIKHTQFESYDIADGKWTFTVDHF